MRSTESRFSELVYLAAAQERMQTANLLATSAAPDFVAATYWGGVAVECLFHAYRIRAGEDDTAKHDLGRHAEISHYYDGMRPSQRQAVVALVGEVAARWQNSHRYRSETSLREYIIRNRLHIVQGRTATRKNVLVYNAGKLLESATEIINIGALRWNLLSIS